VTSSLALVGPTASGKTELAVRLAEQTGAEILCIDSMTVYRAMDVGTAKPTLEQRGRVPHHLLDLTDPAHPFSVAEFQSAARTVIDDITARGAIPLLTGGSGLYFRAVVDELEFPPTNPALRARLQAEDPEELRVRLKELDPEAAAFIDPANIRRVVRALEVIELTGRQFSSFRSAWERYESRYALRVAGIKVSPDALRARIEARVQAQIGAGLFEEVHLLLALGYRGWLTSTQAIPYRQAVAHVDGAITLEEFVEQAARANRRLARRQMSWFRRDPRVRWFDGAELADAERAIRAYLFDGVR
jgi:tRNA dimethylallyltransferase